MRRTLLPALFAIACTPTKPAPTTPTPPVEPAPKPVADAPKSPAVHAKATKVRTVEGITEYKMDNGLQVLLFPDPTQSTVTVNITYLVGSRVEGYGETGMAHLLEHMQFKGTQKLRDIGKLLDAKGAQENASTWTDRTNYFETLPASKENLDWALDMEADRMIHSTISESDLKTEFSVVRNEFERGENDPSGILEERIVSTAYLWHNYGKDTIGSKADIERVPAASLKRFYEKYYQPDDAVLVVSGKFDEAGALQTIENTFGAIPRPTRVLDPSYTVEPVQDGERSVTLRRNGEIHVIGLAYHTVGAASPDYPAVQAAVNVLTREPSGRLYKKLIETKLASAISGGQPMFRDPYLATFTAEVRDGKNVDKVEQTMIAETEGLGASKIDDKEVERWRALTLKNFELTMANSQAVAIRLSTFAALGDWRTMFAYRDRVEKTTTADVQRVAKTFFKQSNRTSGRFVPTKDPDRAPLIETPDVVAAVKGIEGGAVKEQGEAFVASLENIEARTTRKELKGGIKAAFLPKKTRGGKVQLNLTFWFGDAKSLQNRALIGDLTPQLLARGTAKKTYQELRDEIDQLRARISISGSAGRINVHVEALRDKLPATLDLVAEMLTSPSFPAKELELVRQQELAQLEQQLQDPNTIANATAAQVMTPWPKTDPRYPLTPQEEIDAIKKVQLGDLKSYYKDLVGGGHGELAVVGDFDPAAIGTQVEKLFGTWIAKKPYARLEQKPSTVTNVTKSINIKDKESTQVVMETEVAMRDDDADYPAWLMVGHILGGDTGSRAWMRIREHEGLTYGVGAQAYANPQDVAGGFSVDMSVAPQNLSKAKASLLEEVKKLTTGSFTAEELARAREGWIKQQDTFLSNDNILTFLLTQQIHVGRTTEWTQKLRAKLNALTPADIERVAKKWLDPSKLVIIDAGDQAKAK
jgi:zinc protease